MSQEAPDPAKVRNLEDVDGWAMETDVAVIGFGGAGACAAISADDAGADVCIFELASASGGSTALSGGDIYLGGGGGTPVQRACGFEDSSKAMSTFLLSASGPSVDEDRVQLYVDGSIDHYHWLVDCGVPFKQSFDGQRDMMIWTDDCLQYSGNEKAWPFNQIAHPCPRGHYVQAEGEFGGQRLMQVLTVNVESRPIRVHYDARALTLVMDERNTVCGVIVRAEGREIAVRARKGVILCAGGFSLNEQLLRKHAPMLTKATEALCSPGDDGAGILMGLGAGGSTINMHEGFVTLPFYPPASLTNGIIVNSQGQRFVNEDCYHGRVGYFCLQQLEEEIYLVFNADDLGSYQDFNYLSAEICGTGETVGELEQDLGLPENSLVQTVAYYNLHASQGNDPLFHKAAEWLKPLKGPLGALDCTPGRGAFYPFFTLGGLETRPTGEVLKPSGDLVPGLYAAGRTTCGLPRSAAGYASGMSVGDATFFGRLAGRAAAEREI